MGSEETFTPRRLSLPLARAVAAEEASREKAHREPVPAEVLERRAARRTERARLVQTESHVEGSKRVRFVETDLGRRRRVILERLAGLLPKFDSPWSLNGVDSKGPGVVFAHPDGRRLTVQFDVRAGKGYARTRHFMLMHTGARVEMEDRTFLQAIAAAISEAEEKLAHEDGFPEALLDRRPASVAIYAGSNHVELRPTLACNHHCGFCNSVDHTVVNFVHGARELHNMARELDLLPVERVTITGGEPTLLPGLPEAVADFADRGFVVHLQTNGMALDDRNYAAVLADAGLRRAFVSLHSHDPARSDNEITHFPGGWARTVAGIDHALEFGIEIELCHVIHHANAQDTADFLKFVAQRWGDRVRVSVSFVTPTGSAATERRQFLPSLQQVVPPLLEALDFARESHLRLTMQAFCGIPPCLLDRHEGLSEIANVAPVEYGEDHVKLDACRSCVYRDRCPGLWKGYFEIHGDPGLKPVRTAAPRIRN